ncbi:MAG: DNA glycosylase AlkZ-like family protein [Actinomycetota bacterium]
MVRGRDGDGAPSMGGIEDELEAIEVEGRELWLLRRRRPLPTPAGVVRLLGAYDPYLLGYAGRDFAVAPDHAGRVHPAAGCSSRRSWSTAGRGSLEQPARWGPGRVAHRSFHRA